MANKSMRARVQAFGGFLTAMVIPNIGAFIAWGFITALFIPTGWTPNPHFGQLVGPMITYLLPLMIGSTGGHLIGGKRGAVMGGIGTMGVIVGADIPMFIGAMVMGPLGGYLIKVVDKALEKRIPAGFEMVINNFSLGILGMLLCLLAYEVIGPAVMEANNFVKQGIEALVATGYLPLLSVINEPAKVLFLNNAIDQGVYYPLGMQDTAVAGKSIYFMVASNPGPGLGTLLAFSLFGKGLSKKSAPGAMIIHFLGGIHELYFPYVLMKPLMIIAMISGGMAGIYVFELFGAGLVAGPSPGSIFAYLALTPRGGFIGTCAGVLAGTVVSFVVASAILKFDKSPAEDSFADSQVASKKRKAEGKSGIQPVAVSIRLIAFVCDAGMGSSAMGATTFRKKLQKAGYEIEVKHYSIENIPADADIIVTHASLEGRAQRVTDRPLILIKNYLGDPALDVLLADITSTAQQGVKA
jgi:PTS system mannitol-specific IIC component